MDARQTLFATEGICKWFGGVRALGGANLAIRRGEVHTLLGENGAGKSTLVKIIAGALQPDSGSLSWEGKALPSMDLVTSQRLGIRVIHQRLTTISHLSVGENLLLGNEPHRFGLLQLKRARKRAKDALERIGVHLDLDRQAGTLRVAERQLVEIARALIGDARLLVMDEPTASLGEREVAHLFGIIQRLREEGVAIIYISHKLSEVMAISDRVTILRDGQTVKTVDIGSTDPGALVESMVGRVLAQDLADRQATVPDEAVVLEARSLFTRTGLSDISFKLRRREVLGVYGLMGSGRTELARALFGADPLISGSILVDGRPVSPRSPRDARKLGLGLVPEERPQAVFDDLSVLENATIAASQLMSRMSVVRHGLERRLTVGMVKRLGVKTASVDAPMRSLSGGNQQKVVLGRWLLRGSRILILDDPTSGVDVGAKAEIYRLISSETAGGLSVIMSSSELPELLTVAHRILVLHEGRIAGVLEGERMTQRDVLHLAVRGNVDGMAAEEAANPCEVP
ncbi:MAG: sugar ABC transporter ATP-binding protein [Lautropia sp.]|nr:sugar ABC transporter ATP-binding protein [Lautropia sp.]